MQSHISNNNHSDFHIVYNSKQNHRKRAIPKEVNTFVLENYGILYYNCFDCAEKVEILKNIEARLKIAGYENITFLEVERRLKNMKSHYRSKKKDLELGIIKSVEWEYFAGKNLNFNFLSLLKIVFFPALDKIFSTLEKDQSLENNVDPVAPPVPTPVKRKVEPEPVKKTEDIPKAEDL